MLGFQAQAPGPEMFLQPPAEQTVFPTDLRQSNHAGLRRLTPFCSERRREFARAASTDPWPRARGPRFQTGATVHQPCARPGLRVGDFPRGRGTIGLRDAAPYDGAMRI